jgi:predicted CXXCH cytochrome family protein
VAAALEPWLEIRAVGSATWKPLATETGAGAPFYLGTEWRPVLGGRGTVVGPVEEPIAVGDLRMRDRDDPTQTALAGRRLMGRQAAPRLTIPANAYTEVEFTVRATIDAPYTSTYELRLTDAGDALAGAVTARLSVGPRPPVRLSPGQQDGIPVPGPDEATAPTALGAFDHPLVTPDAIRATLATAPAVPRYRLAVAAVPTPPVGSPLAAPGDSPHAPDMSLVSDTCAACHRGHTAAGPNLLAQPLPQSTLCFTCHDGVGSDLDVKSQYTDPAVPANDAATRAYYRHDALAPSDHVSASVDEFGGISNRHSECGDCHNSHIATSTLSSQTATGWTVSGRQTSMSGVAVTNGAAGTTPTYTLLAGEVGSQPTREYEVCLKCHSGWTVLPSNAGQPPSRQALDKAIEFNPSNASYHPIEAAGKNITPAMTDSLDGSSPYKQWNFTTSSTVRCVNCHGDPAKYDGTTPPAAGADLAPHTSEYRGILLQDYRDRVLKSATEGYAAADFALCYLCHAEEPFLNDGSSATNFPLHRKHVAAIAGEGGGGIDIDTAGAGQGNALCAECHFRIHSTALRVAPQDAFPRLINFAPDVQPFNGTLRWEALSGGGSCTLTCHGKGHDGEGY